MFFLKLSGQEEKANVLQKKTFEKIENIFTNKHVKQNSTISKR